MKYLLLVTFFASVVDANFTFEEKEALLEKVAQTRADQRRVITEHIKKFRQMHHLRKGPELHLGKKLSKRERRRRLIRFLNKRRRLIDR